MTTAIIGVGSLASCASVVADMLPASAHFVKAFGALGDVQQLATSANHDPRVVLFCATERLLKA